MKTTKSILTALLLINFISPTVLLAEDKESQHFVEISEEEKQRMREQGDLSRQLRKAKMEEKIIGSTSGFIDVTYVSQGSNLVNCGPASASMILKTLANDNTSQSTLAREMGTGPHGTYPDDIYPVLNNHLGEDIYDWYNYSQGSDLIGDIFASIDEGYPLIYDVLTNKNFPGYTNEKGISHYIVGNGYKSNTPYSMNTISYRDPNGNNSVANKQQVIPYLYLVKGLQDNEGGYYIAKAWNY